MRFLITAGPTNEFIDDIRFISNPSSGKMGIACAEEARSRGHRVVLVAGPVDVSCSRVKIIKVISAGDMLTAARREFPKCDALIMTAAVSDYTPIKRFKGKIKKSPSKLILRLRKTQDILSSLSKGKGGRVVIGFALEVKDEVENAMGKLGLKSLDAIVVNGPSSFRSDYINATIIHADKTREKLGRVTKRALARKLIKLAENCFKRS